MEAYHWCLAKISFLCLLGEQNISGSWSSVCPCLFFIWKQNCYTTTSFHFNTAPFLTGEFGKSSGIETDCRRTVTEPVFIVHYSIRWEINPHVGKEGQGEWIQKGYFFWSGLQSTFADSIKMEQLLPEENKSVKEKIWVLTLSTVSQTESQCIQSSSWRPFFRPCSRAGFEFGRFGWERQQRAGSQSAGY